MAVENGAHTPNSNVVDVAFHSDPAHLLSAAHVVNRHQHSAITDRCSGNFYGTNHVPSDTELLEIEKLLAPHNARLSQLQKDLEQAEAKIARLKKEQEDILKVIKPLKSLSSLIRRFPREVMELIFTYSIPAPAPGTFTYDVCHGPLVLLRVCKMWRDIALNTPQLWTSVVPMAPFHLLHSHGTTSDAKRAALALEQLDQWLGRSKNYPLSISLYGPSPSTVRWDRGHTMRDLASTLLTHSRRWESVNFDAPRWQPVHFIDVVAESLPALKRLRLSASYLLLAYQQRVHFNGLLTAPNLKELQIEAPRLYFPLSKLPVNWTNLTHLYLGGGDKFRLDRSSQDSQLTAPEMLPIIKQCQKLRILSLLLISAPNPLPESETQITLSNLEALNVTGCRSQIHYLLRSIMTPRIREIHYQPFFPPVQVSPFTLTLPLTSFLQRYGNPTEVLSFNLPSVSREDLQSWLECTPALKQLNLGQEFQIAPPPPPLTSSALLDFECAFDDSCISLLTPKQDQPYFCPNLKIFRCSMKPRVSGDAILAFLAARTDPLLVGDGGIIEEVSIHDLPYDSPLGDWTEAEEERLKPIREAGVRLSFMKTFYYQSKLAPALASEPPPGTCVSGFGTGYGVDFNLF
ncbi:hypothetical protein H1R20_g12238, partial [Candolleomyces eurysporus]